jgi:tetratricopeptide (TPR) repeat protein
MIASAIGLAAVGAASVGRQLAAATYLDRAERHLPTAPGAARRDASRSAGLNRFEPRVWYVLAASYARRDDYGHARQALEEAAAVEPFNYVPWALMGDLDTRKGYLKRARLDYARAHRLDPFDPPIRP